MSIHWLIKNKIKDRLARLEERVYTHHQPGDRLRSVPGGGGVQLDGRAAR